MSTPLSSPAFPVASSTPNPSPANGICSPTLPAQPIHVSTPFTPATVTTPNASGDAEASRASAAPAGQNKNLKSVSRLSATCDPLSPLSNPFGPLAEGGDREAGANEMADANNDCQWAFGKPPSPRHGSASSLPQRPMSHRVASHAASVSMNTGDVNAAVHGLNDESGMSTDTSDEPQLLLQTLHVKTPRIPIDDKAIVIFVSNKFPGYISKTKHKSGNVEFGHIPNTKALEVFNTLFLKAGFKQLPAAPDAIKVIKPVNFPHSFKLSLSYNSDVKRASCKKQIQSLIELQSPTLQLSLSSDYVHYTRGTVGAIPIKRPTSTNISHKAEEIKRYILAHKPAHVPDEIFLTPVYRSGVFKHCYEFLLPSSLLPLLHAYCQSSNLLNHLTTIRKYVPPTTRVCTHCMTIGHVKSQCDRRHLSAPCNVCGGAQHKDQPCPKKGKIACILCAAAKLPLSKSMHPAYRCPQFIRSQLHVVDISKLAPKKSVDPTPPAHDSFVEFPNLRAEPRSTGGSQANVKAPAKTSTTDNPHTSASPQFNQRPSSPPPWQEGPRTPSGLYVPTKILKRGQETNRDTSPAVRSPRVATAATYTGAGKAHSANEARRVHFQAKFVDTTPYSTVLKRATDTSASPTFNAGQQRAKRNTTLADTKAAQAAALQRRTNGTKATPTRSEPRAAPATPAEPSTTASPTIAPTSGSRAPTSIATAASGAGRAPSLSTDDKIDMIFQFMSQWKAQASESDRRVQKLESCVASLQSQIQSLQSQRVLTSPYHKRARKHRDEPRPSASPIPPPSFQVTVESDHEEVAPSELDLESAAESTMEHETDHE